MRRFGFFVGIDSYSNGITQLRCACNDANSLYGKFCSAGFDEAVLIPEKDAVSSQIISKLGVFCQKIKSGDLLVFYFAGHGRELNGEHYLIARDGFADANLFGVGSLPMSAILAATGKPGLNRLFILDCCRDNLLAGRGAGFACDVSRSVALDNVIKAQTGFIPPLILNSCSSGEKSLEDLQSGHGYFTAALLKTIDDTAVKGFYDFRKTLQKNMKSPGLEQNICWNGNVDAWDEVELFDDWQPDICPTFSTPSAEPARPMIPANFYALQWDADKLTRDLADRSLTLTDGLQKLKWMATKAEECGDYRSAIKNLQEFIAGASQQLALAGTEKIPADEEQLVVEEKHVVDARRVAKAKRNAKIQKELHAAQAQGIKFDQDGKTLIQCPKNVEKVVIPESVTAIGDKAFAMCSHLTDLTIPNSVRSIGDEAFLGCTSLSEVIISSRVISIGNVAFWGVRSIKIAAKNPQYYIGDSGVMIDRKNKKLLYCPPTISGHYTIPAEVTAIGESAFYGCANLNSVTLGSNVIAIGGKAFFDCENLTHVTISGGVTTIREWTFGNCKNLRRVTLPGSVSSIWYSAFYGCVNLSWMAIPLYCQIANDAFPVTCQIIRW